MILTFSLPFPFSHSLARLHDTHLANVNTQVDPEDQWAESSDYQQKNLSYGTEHLPLQQDGMIIALQVSLTSKCLWGC